MTLPQTIFAMACVLLVAGYAWFLIFRPHMLARKARESIEKRNLQDNPLAYYMICRSWYPTFLRCVGVFIWLWVVAFLSIGVRDILTDLQR
jgi:hypothetical protein